MDILDRAPETGGPAGRTPAQVSLLFVGPSGLEGTDIALALSGAVSAYHAVRTPGEAILAFARLKPDMIVAEGLGDREPLCAMIDSMRRIKPQTPVILPVDLADPEGLREFLSVRQAIFLPQPFGVPALVSAVNDISDGILAKRAGAEQRHLFAMALARLPGPALVIERATRTIVLANNTAEELGLKAGGRAEGDFFGDGAIGPADDATFEELEAYYTGRKSVEARSGGRIWDVVVAPLSSTTLIATASDVSRRKHAEEALRRAQESLESQVAERTGELLAANERLKSENTLRQRVEKLLRASDEQYRALAENSPDIIIRFDRALRHLYVNKAITELAGFPPGAYIGKTVAELVSPESLRQLWELHLREVFENGKAAKVSFETETQKGTRTFDWQLIPEHGMDGAVDTVLTIARDITELKQVEAKLTQLATTDALTGLINRRHFLEMAESEILRAQRYGSQLSLLMMDADHFKAINDTYGHDVGDMVLKSLALVGRRCLRVMDLFGRLGGEEFAALLPETGLEAARHVAERIRECVAGAEIASGQGFVHVTVSVGAAAMTGREDIFELLRRADKALYEAKAKGRNRVEMG